MAYANSELTPRQKLASVGLVAGLHGVIGIALIAGLAVSGVIELDDRTKSKFIPVPEPTEPPPPPPPAPEPTADSAPDIEVPKIPRPMPTRDPYLAPPSDPVPDPGPTVRDPTGLPSGQPTGAARPTPTPTPAPAPTTPAILPKDPVPTNNPGTWATTNDYPTISLRRKEAGAATFRVSVGTDGRVKACEIVRSSGHSRLDDATCSNVSRRARFTAATDSIGAKVVGTYTNTIRWQLPD